MSDEVRSEEKETSIERVKSPKPTKETWLKARVDYESGNYDSVKELAAKYGIDYKKLRDKAYEDDWQEFKVTTNGKIRQVIEERSVNKVEKFFLSLEEKANRYNKMLVASQESLGSKTQDGTPLLDPDALDTYSKVESRVVDWQKTAYGINDKIQVNADVNVNVTHILEKIRERKDVVDVESETVECKALLDELKE